MVEKNDGIETGKSVVKNTELTDLLARVRAATGPDRELDGDLWFALDHDSAWAKCGWRGYVYGGARFTKEEKAARIRRSAAYQSPALTASLDAALALVKHALPGVWWLVRSGDEGEGDFANLGPAGTNPNEGGDCWSARANTPPLALLAALLTALPLFQIAQPRGERGLLGPASVHLAERSVALGRRKT